MFHTPMWLALFLAGVFQGLQWVAVARIRRLVSPFPDRKTGFEAYVKADTRKWIFLWLALLLWVTDHHRFGIFHLAMSYVAYSGLFLCAYALMEALFLGRLIDSEVPEEGLALPMHVGWVLIGLGFMTGGFLL